MNDNNGGTEDKSIVLLETYYYLCTKRFIKER